MENKHLKPLLIFLMLLAGSVVFFVFETPLAENTIDYLSFMVGIFLVTEASYGIINSKDKFYPDQLLRLGRIVIGTCVFSIHLFQFAGKI